MEEKLLTAAGLSAVRDYQFQMNSPSQELKPAAKKQFSFHRENRIKRKSDFDLLYKKGKRFSSLSYSVFLSDSISKRLGIAIPKRLGNAVFRNKQKRIVRECFRKEKEYITRNFDIVFVLKKHPADKYSQREELKRIFQWLSK